MKTIAYLFLLLMVCSTGLYAESFRRTSADLFTESYMAQMRRGTYSPAEARAGEYSSMYETCDEHHNCVSETAGGMQAVRKDEKHTDPVKPFVPLPMWM